MLPDWLWQVPRRTNARLEKKGSRVGVRFPGAYEGLGSAEQALGTDMVRLRSCLNVKPDTVVVVTGP